VESRASAEKFPGRGGGNRKKQDRKIAQLSPLYIINTKYENAGRVMAPLLHMPTRGINT